MQTQNTKTAIDFTGQNIYVGIDTHHKSWMVSIYSDEFEFNALFMPIVFQTFHSFVLF